MEPPPKRVREDSDDEADGAAKDEPQDTSTICRRKLEKGVKRVRKGLCSPGQSLSLIHAGVASVLTILLQVRSEDPESESATTLAHDDPRLCYIRALSSGGSLLKATGYKNDRPNKIWAFQLEVFETIPLLVDALRDVLVSLAEEINTFDKSRDVKVAEEFPDMFPDAATQALACKSVGCLLGGIVGNLLGAPIASWDEKVVRKWFRKVYEVHALPPAGENDASQWAHMSFSQLLGVYSAEISLQLQLARSILLSKSLNAKQFLSDATKTIQTDRPRHHTLTVKALIADCASGRHTAADNVSFTPGLVVPLAIAFRHSDQSALLSNLRDVLRPFASNLDAIASSFLLYHAVLYLLPIEDAATFSGARFVQNLLQQMRGQRLSDHIETRLQVLLCDLESGASDIAQRWEGNASTPDVLDVMCNAVTVFAVHHSTPVLAVVTAVNSGHHASSMGLIVGSLIGALHGYQWIPSSWYASLQNDKAVSDGTVPRDDIVHLATLLADVNVVP